MSEILERTEREVGLPGLAKLLESELLSPTREEFEGVECVIDSERTEGRGYYPDFCFNVRATDRAGRALTLVDGGSVDWTQRLLSNGKERLVTSGIGSERVCVEFPSGGAAPQRGKGRGQGSPAPPWAGFRSTSVS